MPHLSPRTLAIPVWALTAISFALAVDLGAQEVSEESTVALIGQVVDSVTGRAVVGAAVSVVETGRFDITDDEGRFALRAHTGPVTLRVEQIGYAELHEEITANAQSGPVRLLLEPRPMVLEGLQVMIDRLAARRLASAMSVQTLGAEELRHAGSNLLRALRHVPGMILVTCPGASEILNGCVYRRGRIAHPSVHIDDVAADGGLYELAAYSPAEIYALEVYGAGARVRVYTRTYMDRLARFPRALHPVG